MYWVQTWLCHNLNFDIGIYLTIIFVYEPLLFVLCMLCAYLCNCSIITIQTQKVISPPCTIDLRTVGVNTLFKRTNSQTLFQYVCRIDVENYCDGPIVSRVIVRGHFFLRFSIDYNFLQKNNSPDNPYIVANLRVQSVWWCNWKKFKNLIYFITFIRVHNIVFVVLLYVYI